MPAYQFHARGGISRYALWGLLLLAGCPSPTSPVDADDGLKVEPVSPAETQPAKDREAKPAAALAKALPLDTSQGLIGLLALPLLDAAKAATAKGPLTVYQTPSSKAAPVATLTRDGVTRPPAAPCPWKGTFDLEEKGCGILEEMDYEVPALPVYQVAEGGWYLIAVDPAGKEGGWLHSEEPFTPLSKLVGEDERLTYLTPLWDGVLYREPGGKSFTPRLPKVGEAKEYPYQAKQIKEYKGKLWIEVGILNEICTSDKPKEVDHGWVEAVRAGGKRQAWFYSRGC